MKDSSSNIELSNKILAGLKLSFEKLLIQKRNQKGVLVFSRDGKIIRYLPTLDNERPNIAL